MSQRVGTVKDVQMLALYSKVLHQSLCGLQSMGCFLQASTLQRNWVKLCWFNNTINYLSDYETGKQPGARVKGLSSEVARLHVNLSSIIYHLWL